MCEKSEVTLVVERPDGYSPDELTSEDLFVDILDGGFLRIQDAEGDVVAIYPPGQWRSASVK